MRLPIRIADFLVIFCVISLVVVQMPQFANDPGLGWHLATGSYIDDHHALPEVDPFLHYKAPRAWIVDQWLGSYFLYSLYSLGSWPLLYSVLAAIYLLTYLLILERSLVSVTKLALPSLLGTLLAFKIGQIHFIVRPVMLSFPLFALTFGALLRLYHQSEDLHLFRRAFKINLFILPAIFILWANIHPTFTIGLFLVALLPFCLYLDHIFLKPVNTQILLKLVLLWGLCCLASLVNPYGLNLHRSVLDLSQNSFAMNFYMEWQRPDFRAFEGLLFELPLVVIGICILVGRQTDRPWRFFELLALICFAHFSLGAVRMLPFFGIVAAYPLAKAVSSLRPTAWGKLNFYALLERAFGRIEKHERNSKHGELFLMAVVTLLVAASVLNDKVPFYPDSYGPSRTEYPYAALEFIRSKPFSKPLVIANEMSWGGFIAWYAQESALKLKPLIDDRTTMIGEPFYREYFKRFSSGEDWRVYLKELEATHLLISKDSNLAKVLKKYKELTLLYEDDLSVLFEL